VVREIYEKNKGRPKIEMRIDDCISENYEYLDLSSLKLNNEYLNKLLEIPRIKDLMIKIKYLDLSQNNLNEYPNIKKYPNIIYLDIHSNKINGMIEDNNIIELTCFNNNISFIKSDSMLRLLGDKNILEKINTPNVKKLIVNYNKLIKLDNMINVLHIEATDNNLIEIINMPQLKELYVTNNNIYNIDHLNMIEIVNLINNPIEKLKYFENMECIICNNNLCISNKYNIESMNKLRNNLVINLKK
jgi:hypothetical protein